MRAGRRADVHRGLSALIELDAEEAK